MNTLNQISQKSRHSSHENPPKSLHLTPEQSNTIGRSMLVQTNDLFSASYKDPYQTFSQQERDILITGLLRAYYLSYLEKGKVKKICQVLICIVCTIFMLVSLFLLAVLTWRFAFSPNDFSNLKAVASFITAFVGFIGSIFGLVNIVTRYAFPENDEKHITNIVKSIQENDFKTIVESHKSQPVPPPHSPQGSSPIEISHSDNDM